MNRRVLLAFGAIAVVAAAVILYLAINADNSSANSRTTTDETVARADESTKTAATSKRTTKTTTTTTSTTATTTSDGVKEYYVDGQKIRDHRKGDRPPVTEPPPRDQVRKLPVAITQDICGKFQAVFKDCMKAVPKEAKGEKPRATGSLVVEIKDQQLKVTETQLTFNNITPDAAAVAKQCIEKNAVGLSTGAANEADVERHTIALNLAIR